MRCLFHNGGSNSKPRDSPCQSRLLLCQITDSAASKTTDFSLTVPEGRSPRSASLLQTGLGPPAGSGTTESSFSSLWWLFLCHHGPCSLLSVSPYLPLIRTGDDFGAPLGHPGLSLSGPFTESNQQSAFSQILSHSQGPGVRTWMGPFWGHYSAFHLAKDAVPHPPSTPAQCVTRGPWGWALQCSPADGGLLPLRPSRTRGHAHHLLLSAFRCS